MSITSMILIILTFIVNFIMNYSFWSIMVSLAFMVGYKGIPYNDGTLLIKLSLASLLIPAILVQFPFMERFFVFSNSGRTPHGEEESLLRQFLAEVCERAHLNPSDYPLYVGRENIYNAFSLGKSIVIMEPLLHQFPEDELIGVMAHEMGHIQHGDTRYGLICVGLSWFGQVIILVYNLLFLIFRLFMWIPFLGLFLSLLALFIKLQYQILDIFLQVPMIVISRFGSRNAEYEADRYACELGLGRELAMGLAHLESIYGSGKSSLFQRLMNDHPDTDKRIRRIEEYLRTHP